MSTVAPAAGAVKPSPAPAPKTEKEGPKVIHQLDKKGRHRLVVDGEVGEPAGSDEIAGCGDFCATCNLHAAQLPQVFKVTPVTEFITQTDVIFDK